MSLRHCAWSATALLAISTAPAMAQSVSCGGIGDTGIWIGGTPGASDLSVAGAPFSITGISIPPGERAVALFSVSAGMEVRVEAAPAGEGDTVLELYDDSGRLVVTDDDSGGDLSSRAELPLEPGSYCLAARAFGGGAVEANLQVSRLDQPALTAGLAGGFAGTEAQPPFVGIDPCLPSTPAATLGDGPIDGLLSTGVSATDTTNGTPYYRFTLATPQALTVRAENPAADPYIYFFDGSGNLLAENDDADGLNSRIDFSRPLPPGQYCIGMRALSDPDLPVTLSVAGFDASGTPSAPGFSTGVMAPPLDGSVPINDLGVIPARSVRDARVQGGETVWYSFEVLARELVLIDAIEVNDSDPMITVFDDLGRLIGENDDSNGTLNSQLAVRLEPGRYMLGVRQFSPSYNGIIRIAMERFVSAQQ